MAEVLGKGRGARAAIFIASTFALEAARPVQAAGPVVAQDLAKRPDAWFAGDEGRKIVANVLSWQTPGGGWAKGYDVNTPRVGSEPYGTWDGIATIDNSATYSELRLLARAYVVDPRPEVLAAFDKGFDALVAAQYPSGGWPQRFPPTPDGYGRYITFNDGAMTGVMRLMRDVDTQPAFSFVDNTRRVAARTAFDRGVSCIVRCQILKDGKRTGWCAQHDPDTFAPRGARAYELPSVSGSEGADVTLLLMELDHPDASVRQAIIAAAAWFESAKVPGKRIDERPDPSGKSKRNLILVDDPSSVLWGRFYDLNTNRPFFADRQGHVSYDYNDLPLERRDGYRWYGNWGERVLVEFERWKSRHAS